MEFKNACRDTLDQLFRPRSIAIVGLPQSMKTGKLFLMALQDMGFKGPIYPVNPNVEVIDGLRCYPSVTAIKGPVDLAIILVPRHLAHEAVRQCAAKAVKTAVLFTAGYKETGTRKGLRMENQLVAIARRSGMRLLGPNCMGIYAPRTGLSFFPQLPRAAGRLSLISHSGSLANIICRQATDRGMAFNKVVSLGNEADLHSADFLSYFAQEPESTVIGGYIEGITHGREFLTALRRAAAAKPVVLWKVGRTPAGARAAASHTGALVGSEAVWNGVMRQCGAVPVVGWDAWIDTLMAFYHLPPATGRRVAVISGPGGLAVAAADAVYRMGLEMARLSAKTLTHLSRRIPPTGTSLANPVDVSLAAHLETPLFAETAETVADDPNVDAVLVIGSGLNDATNRTYIDTMLHARRQSEKPFLIVAVPGMAIETGPAFCGAGVPFFRTVESALGTYARVVAYYRHRDSRARSSHEISKAPLTLFLVMAAATRLVRKRSCPLRTKIAANT